MKAWLIKPLRTLVQIKHGWRCFAYAVPDSHVYILAIGRLHFTWFGATNQGVRRDIPRRFDTISLAFVR